MTHRCTDHGHYCPECEEDQDRTERHAELMARCARWNMDSSPTAVAVEIIRDDIEWDEIEPVMLEFGYTPDQVMDVEIAHSDLEGVI